MRIFKTYSSMHRTRSKQDDITNKLSIFSILKFAMINVNIKFCIPPPFPPKKNCKIRDKLKLDNHFLFSFCWFFFLLRLQTITQLPYSLIMQLFLHELIQPNFFFFCGATQNFFSSKNSTCNFFAFWYISQKQLYLFKRIS